MITYSLPGITRAGSKGMISARNIKAPLFIKNVFRNGNKSICYISNLFSGAKIKKTYL